MPRYVYKAISAAGRITRGEMDASSIMDLELRLRRMDFDLILARPSRRILSGLSMQIPVRERVHFCFHLEQLLRAGLPLLDALSDLRDSTTHERLKMVIGSLVDSIGGGKSLSQAMAGHPQVFDTVFLALVHAGETSGELPHVLEQINHMLKREDELSSFLRKLCLYPGFVLAVTLGAVIVSMTFVVPELAKLFRAIGAPLPTHTRTLLAISNLVSQHGLALAWVSLSATLASVTAIRRHPVAAYRWDQFKLALPFVGEVYRKIILARFSALFALLYASGIPVIETLGISRGVVANRVLGNALDEARELISQGRNLSGAFSASAVFPALVVRMLKLGEQTGSLDTSLRNVSHFFERDVRESIARFQILLEPILILVMGGLMLWIAAAILGPIYDVITKMKI